MSEELNKACPYCGQVNLTGVDSRLLCGCLLAAKFRRLRNALEEVGGEDSPISQINFEVMDALTEIAHQICMQQIESAPFKLSDGTTVKIGSKVVRTHKVELKEEI